MVRVYLSLGSNLGDRVALLKGAVAHMRAVQGVRVVDASRLYDAEPWEEEPGQALNERRWYLNCVVAVDTELGPRELLHRLQSIETALGRTRPQGTPEAGRFAPRTLDIDILFYGDQVISVPDDLHIPHLLLHERAFVLRPLAELAPGLRHPTDYRTVRELLEDVEDEHRVGPGDYPPRWFED